MIAKRRWIRRLNFFKLPEMGWIESHGRRIYVDLGDWKGPSYHILNWGLESYATQEIEWLRKCIMGLQSRGPVTLFDIGANIGIFSFVLGSEFKNLQIHAFEPNAMAFACLRATFEKDFPNVKIHPVALSDKVGEAKLFSDGPNHGGHSLHSDAIIEDGDVVTGEVSVQTDTLDRFAADMKVDLLKIDVQRHEAQLLKGAAKTIAAHRPIVVMECYFKDLEAPDSELLRPFKGHQYAMIEPNSNKLFGFEHEDLLKLQAERPDGPYCDLIFVPVEKLDILKSAGAKVSH